jgi:ABC-type antimicrobial peptide transport system permease subunit
MKPEVIASSLRTAVASIDKDLPLLDIRTQNEQIEDTTKQEMVFASLTSGFGLLALVLACIGIYGLMANSVARRTNEIGIRIALGMQSRWVQRMIICEESLLATVCVVVGVSVGLAMSRLIASMLYGLKSYDPLTFTGASLLLIVVALSASWLPARRASSIDPLKALRHE